MLTTFSGVWERKITDEIISAYYYVLKKYQESDVQEAGYQAMEKYKYFPKPSELVSFIAKKQEDTQYEANFAPDNSPVKIWPNVRCRMCGKIGMCIQEDDTWQCRQCYTGLTNEEIADRWEQATEKLRGF